MRHVAATLTLLALVAVPAFPEDVPGTPATVRVLLRNQDSVQGYLRGRSKDELVVFTSDGKFRHLPMVDVQRFEVRSRTGSHAKRGALLGVVVWASLMTAARFGALDEAGFASWQSGAILAGGVGVGALIGSRVPRYGWRVTEARSVRAEPTPPPTPPLVRFTLRF
jgi:hypothetical protein